MTAPVQQVTGDLSESLFTGGGSVSDVPWKWPIAIGGRPYMIDTKMTEAWRHKGIPLLRQQQDNSTSPSGVSVSSEGVWRAGVDSWHKGAGQNYRDRPDSNEFRFRASKGVDPWTRYQLGLLPATDQKKASVNTNVKLCVAGDRLFCVDGADVTYTTDATVDSPTWTNCTNEPGGTILDIASDGEYVWITDGANSYWADASASPPAFNLAGWTGTQDADTLGYVKGRLLSGHDNTLHFYDSGGAATAITIPGVLPSTWTWVGFAGGDGNSVIYAAGYAGDKSQVYRIGLKDDGTLDVAIPATPGLPDGEIVRAISSYLGFVLLGTDKGVRFAAPGSSGNLQLGPLLETAGAVECFEGQGPHVWFGWKNYDSTSTGLGRMSLEEFSSAETLAPAYASDLMATAQGAVLSVVTFGGRRYFTVSGSGVWGEDSVKVASGTVQSGRITANVAEAKTVFGVDVRHRSITGGSSTVALSVDGGSFTTLGSALSADGSVPAEAVGREFEVQFTLAKSGSDHPVLSSWTLRYYPRVKRQTVRVVPVVLHNAVTLMGGGDESVDVAYERSVLTGHYRDGAVVTVQTADGVFSAVVDDFEWIPHHSTEFGGQAEQGTMVLTLKEVA